MGQALALLAVSAGLGAFLLGADRYLPAGQHGRIVGAPGVCRKGVFLQPFTLLSTPMRKTARTCLKLVRRIACPGDTRPTVLLRPLGRILKAHLNTRMPARTGAILIGAVAAMEG